MVVSGIANHQLRGGRFCRKIADGLADDRVEANELKLEMMMDVMGILGIAGMIVGGLCVFVGVIWYIVEAFKESALWMRSKTKKNKFLQKCLLIAPFQMLVI